MLRCVRPGSSASEASLLRYSFNLALRSSHILLRSCWRCFCCACRKPGFFHDPLQRFEPASERGQKGMDELHEQTVNLLSFQPLPKKVFDVQIAFNMVSRYGEEAKPSLAGVQERIVRDYKSIAGDAPMPFHISSASPDLSWIRVGPAHRNEERDHRRNRAGAHRRARFGGDRLGRERRVM